MLLLLSLLCMIKPYLSAYQLPSYAKQGCEEKCGDVTIPYPFGIDSNCSIHDGFAITCNHTLSPPKPFLKNTNLEVFEIDLLHNLLYINNPIISLGCSSIVDSGRPTNLSEIPLSPFSYSAYHNRFVSTSCNHFAKLSFHGNMAAECGSICNASSSGKCDGINCCQTLISYPLKYINASMEKIHGYDDKNTCKMMFIADDYWVDELWVDNNWVNNTTGNITHVPAYLDWEIFDGNRTSQFEDSSSTYCHSVTSGGYVCECHEWYVGNPYLGCEV